MAPKLLATFSNNRALYELFSMRKLIDEQCWKKGITGDKIIITLESYDMSMIAFEVKSCSSSIMCESQNTLKRCMDVLSICPFFESYKYLLISAIT